ncbi:MAG: DUF72 domain-containing protein [Actinobacteria bacterium]|nr:DUF72 domain-containing protein [Actinomycetota bacterium]
MGEIRVGTASWTDRTLIEEADWYPKRSMSAEERLRYYADRFRMVEVDSTYYFPPSVALVEKWIDRTPDDFRFDVKAYSLLTGHPTQERSVWDDVLGALPDEHRGKRNVYLDHLPDDAVDRAWERFREALRPLDSAGKLGAVFFQYPPWFHPGRPARRTLQDLAGRLEGFDVAVELRNASWFGEDDSERTLALLDELDLAYVCVDEPQGFDNSVPPITAVTHPRLAVLRMHGHNRENWNRKGISAAERFRYLYEEEELEAWVPQVRELADQARETHVVFNNCYRDYGVRNAAQMSALLGVADG